MLKNSDESQEINLKLTGRALSDVRDLCRELGLKNEDSVVIYALRVFIDAVDAGLITAEQVKDRTITDPRSYANSWVQYFRLAYAISSLSGGDLSKITKIHIFGKGFRRGIDWQKDWNNFSNIYGNRIP